MKNHVSFKNFPFSTLVPQTRNLQFWQPHWSFSGTRPNFFRSMSEEDKRNTFFPGKHFFSKSSNENSRNSFDKTAELFKKKTEFFSFEVRTCFENWTFSKKKFFDSECSCGHVEPSFVRRIEFLLAEGQQFFTQFQKMLIKRKMFFGKTFFFEKFIWKQKMQLRRPSRRLDSRKL